MADERLRRLGRQAAAGDVGAAASLLRERARLGEVPPLGLEVAAFLGDPAARAAVVAPPAPPPTTRPGRPASPGSGALLVRAAVAAGRLLLPLFEEGLPGDPRARRAVEAAAIWLDCPCETCRTDARLASEDAAELEAVAVDLALDDACVFAATVLSLVAAVAGELLDERAAFHFDRLLLEAETALVEAERPDGSARRALSEALLDWALGRAPEAAG